MSLRFHALLSVVLLLVIPAMARACLWDYDTLKQELARFPTTLELITGKFARHSIEFYQWRIRDRLAKLESDPNNLQYHDDLAVAYEKTGEHEKAIATMLAKEKIKPGLYETYSNLGTFYILAGDFEAGLPYINKALAINPDAHFGREKYQKWLVEYAMSRRKDGKLSFPMRGGETIRKGFDNFIADKLKPKKFSTIEQRSAVKGVLGMMRFANHENPLLLEALGDLLTSFENLEIDAKQLAARAYLQASYVVDDPAAQEGYVKLAEQTLTLQIRKTARSNDKDKSVTLAEVKKQLETEQAIADKWYAELLARERRWIRSGKDAEAQFDRFVAELDAKANR